MLHTPVGVSPIGGLADADLLQSNKPIVHNDLAATYSPVGRRPEKSQLEEINIDTIQFYNSVSIEEGQEEHREHQDAFAVHFDPSFSNNFNEDQVKAVKSVQMSEDLPHTDSQGEISVNSPPAVNSQNPDDHTSLMQELMGLFCLCTRK